MSTAGHGPSFAKYKKEYTDVCLSACCDLNEDKAIAYKEKFGFEKHYTDYKKMLDEIRPDVVALMSPVNYTKELSISIINMGYNIILEKPPGLNVEEITEMINATKEKSIYVRTAFNRRYTPLILKLKELIKNKQIFNITYQMYRYGRNDDDFATTAIHAIDVVKNIAGADYKKIDFKYQNVPGYSENVVNIYMDAEFENGTMSQISLVRMGGAVIERLTVNTLGESYFVELPVWNNLDCPGCIKVIKEAKLANVIDGNDIAENEMYIQSGFYEENRSFFEMIRNEKSPYSDLESGIQSVDIANYIRAGKKEYVK